MTKQYRQGDVLLMEISELPTEAKEFETDPSRIVLAWGEVTGHSHSVSNKDAKYFQASSDQNFLVVESPTNLVHEEHNAIPLPIGIYRVIRQREYTPGSIDYVRD